MKLNILSKKLQDAGLGVEGQSLFLYELPGTVAEGIVIKSPLDGIKIDHELTNFFKTPIQVIVRSSSHASGELLAAKISDLLSTEQSDIWTDGTNSIRINYCRLVSLPIRYPRSDGNGIEWSLNFDFCYVLL